MKITKASRRDHNISPTQLESLEWTITQLKLHLTLILKAVMLQP